MAKFKNHDGEIIDPILQVTTTSNGLMSSADKTKLNGIAVGANNITVDSALNTTSTNPVQNKIVNAAITAKANSTDLITHTSNKNNPHGVTLAQIGAAAASHNHSASNITSGTLPVARGGTGQTSIASILSSLGLSNYGLACSAVTTTSSTTLPVTTLVKVPLNSFKINTDTNVFSFSSNGIKVNKAGYILVSGSVYVLHNDQLNIGAYIYKNSAEVTSQYLNTMYSSAISTGAKIISVTVGDIIYLYARSSKAAACANEVTTYLDIMYIK